MVELLEFDPPTSARCPSKVSTASAFTAEVVWNPAPHLPLLNCLGLGQGQGCVVFVFLTRVSAGSEEEEAKVNGNAFALCPVTSWDAASGGWGTRRMPSVGDALNSAGKGVLTRLVTTHRVTVGVQ